jgi:Ca-activated chloride channel family protein
VDLFARAFEPGQDETLTLDLGLLFDTSFSMIDDLRLSREAVVRFLDAVPRARELFTIFFSEDIHVSRYDSENQQGLIERIQEVQGGGNTVLYDAIAVYLSRVQDSPGRKVLVLFTDGEDSRSRLSMAEVVNLVRSSSVVIYPISFAAHFPPGSPRALLPTAFLQQLAQITGGQVFTLHSAKELPAIYDKILDELKAQYVLGYSSDRPLGDGRFRKLKVEVKGQGLKVRHRAGYYPARAVPSSD